MNWKYLLFVFRFGLGSCCVLMNGFSGVWVMIFWVSFSL